MSLDSPQVEESECGTNCRVSDAKPVLVMGIGNILLRDEGVGVRVIEAMQRLDLPPTIELADAGTAGADLVDFIADREKVIVVDAIDAGMTPGTVFRLCGDELMPTSDVAISLHQLGLVESLTIAEQLECAPKEVLVIGVQPKEIRPGLELSATVANAVPKALDTILHELRRSSCCQ